MPWAEYLEQRRGGVPNKETLTSLYFEQRLSLSEIAKAFGVSRQCVYKWLKGAGLNLRDVSTASRNYYAKNPLARSGSLHPCWKGGRIKSAGGYVYLWKPSHPRATSTGYVLEHRVIAERALGKFLPVDAIVHHVNGNGHDNRPRNLVICENIAYHSLLHARARGETSAPPRGLGACQEQKGGSFNE